MFIKLHFRKANRFLQRVKNKSQITNEMDDEGKEAGLIDKPDNDDTDDDQWEYYDDSTTLTDLWQVSKIKSILTCFLVALTPN